MGKVDHQSEIVVLLAHFFSETRRNGSRPDDGRFVHVIVEDLKHDLQVAFALCIFTQSGSRFHELRIAFLKLILAVFSAQETEAERSDLISLVNAFEKCFLRRESLFLIKIICVHSCRQQSGRRSVIHAHFAVMQ